MISGAHMIIYSTDAEADRAFFRNVLGFPAIDAGEGWLIFALPPAEIAVHPAAETDSHEGIVPHDACGARAQNGSRTHERRPVHLRAQDSTRRPNRHFDRGAGGLACLVEVERLGIAGPARADRCATRSRP